MGFSITGVLKLNIKHYLYQNIFFKIIDCELADQIEIRIQMTLKIPLALFFTQTSLQLYKQDFVN